MGVVAGPVLVRSGGYAFDTWSVDGVSRGYVYRRIEDAHYARRAEILRATVEPPVEDASEPVDDVCVCSTLDQFTTELVERGVRAADHVLQALFPLRMA
jgi:hypothetical protein